MIHIPQLLLAGKERGIQELDKARIRAGAGFVPKDLLHDLELVEDRTELLNRPLSAASKMAQDAPASIRLYVSDEVVSPLEETRSRHVRK